MHTSQLQHWYDEVWNNANEAAIDQLLDPDAEIDGLETDTEKRGSVAFKPFYQGFRQSFPEVHIDLEPIYANEEIEVAKCDVHATAADGKKVAFTGLTVAKFRNGKLIKGWNAFDFLKMTKQLEAQSLADMEQPK